MFYTAKFSTHIPTPPLNMFYTAKSIITSSTNPIPIPTLYTFYMFYTAKFSTRIPAPTFYTFYMFYTAKLSTRIPAPILYMFYTAKSKS